MAAITPEGTMMRTQRLWQEYEELRGDMAQDLDAVDDRMIKPALQARDCLRGLRKTIKRREDRKVPHTFSSHTDVDTLTGDSWTTNGTKTNSTAAIGRPRGPKRRQSRWPKPRVI